MNTRSQTKAYSTATAASTSSSISIGGYSHGDDETPQKPKIAVISWLEKLLEPILRIPNLGNANAGLKNSVTLLMDEVDSSAPLEILENNNFALGDQIKLSISYADTSLTWSFLFCWLDPSVPPEMRFDDLEFQPDFPNYEEYFNWDPYSSAMCFKSLLHRLFDDYRKYQFGFCEKQNRIAMELGYLREAGIAEDTFDLYVYKDGARKDDVVFIFPICSPAVAELPTKYLTEGALEERARLKIRFTSLGDGKAHADLELSPFFNKLFTGKTLKLPAMQCLVCEYVDDIKRTLDEEISIIGDTYKFRRDLISMLIAEFPRESLIDYTGDDFTSVSFLLDHQDFKYICKVILNEKFPVGLEAVKISFTSVYHESKTEPSRLASAATKKPRFDPYSLTATMPKMNARWTVEEATGKIRDFVQTKIEEFKRQSCQKGV